MRFSYILTVDDVNSECILMLHLWALSNEIGASSYLEGELFVEDGVQRVSEHFGLAGFGLVGADVDLDVRVRASSQVHGLQAVGPFDPDPELRRPTGNRQVMTFGNSHRTGASVGLHHRQWQRWRRWQRRRTEAGLTFTFWPPNRRNNRKSPVRYYHVMFVVVRD